MGSGAANVRPAKSQQSIPARSLEIAESNVPQIRPKRPDSDAVLAK